MAQAGGLAREEAEAIGRVKKKSFGSFIYGKVLNDGSEVRPIVGVFLIEVPRTRKRFPEMVKRETVWLTHTEAARR